MGKVAKNSGINITRRIVDPNISQVGLTTIINGASGPPEPPLGNKIFNGYVYNLSLTVGINGDPSTLILNLALNKSIKDVKTRARTLENRRIFSPTPLRPNIIYPLKDDDFAIEDKYIGINAAYDITIGSTVGQKGVELFNFKITSYSISKKNNEKILTLTLSDNSIVLNKIFVGVLGEQIAVDGRSLERAVIHKVVMHCPAVNYSKSGIQTRNNLEQYLHYASSGLGQLIKNALKQEATVYIGHEKGFSFINITSPKLEKNIKKGYGAIIILGEEEFKDGECSSSNITYSFNTLLAAMENLGFEIKTLRDKTKGKIRRNFSGTLKEVLNQWCDLYSYSYVVEFSQKDKLIIKGFDLSTNISTNKVLETKFQLENLDFSSNVEKPDFVITSQNVECDLSQTKLKLYSSYYFKEARDKSLSFEQVIGKENLYNMNLSELFPQWFTEEIRQEIGSSGFYTIVGYKGYDFCGAQRTYNQVVTSAVLGKFSPKLRQIYNYAIGAWRALGFLFVSPEQITRISSRLRLKDDTKLRISEAISSVLEIQAENLFDRSEKSKMLPKYTYDFGFYNQEMVNQIERIENYIADFIGKHFWTKVMPFWEGSTANSHLFNKFEVVTQPASQKFYNDQIFSLPIIQEAQFLTQKLSALFEGQKTYFSAYAEIEQAERGAQKACELSNQYYKDWVDNSKKRKDVIFYTDRPGASYSSFEEFIRQLETFEYSLGASIQLATINLVDIFVPTFKELSPVAVGLLQSVLPINIPQVLLADFKFGLLASLIPKYQIYKIIEATDEKPAINQIEFIHKVKNICETISKILDSQISRRKGQMKNSCSKTVLYWVCVHESEKAKILKDDESILDASAGPDPLSCRVVKIQRALPSKELIFANVMKLTTDKKYVGSALNVSAIPSGADREKPENRIKYFDFAAGKTRDYLNMVTGHGSSLGVDTVIKQSIVLPSENTYKTTLLSKTSSEVFMPSEQYIKGGLEDPNDVKKILENEQFSLEIFTHNITPNVRELYADQSIASYINSQTIQTVPVLQRSTLDGDDGTGNGALTTYDTAPTEQNYTVPTDKFPIIVSYQGIETTIGLNGSPKLPNYEFNSFLGFHKSLKDVYDQTAISMSGQAISFSMDLFCSSINTNLKNLLSINNGLTNLNITLGEGGLNLTCQFRSKPAKENRMDILLYQNKPNIKFHNMNLFS